MNESSNSTPLLPSFQIPMTFGQILDRGVAMRAELDTVI